MLVVMSREADVSALPGEPGVPAASPQDLLERVATGDQTAFSALYDQLAPEFSDSSRGSCATTHSLKK